MTINEQFWKNYQVTENVLEDIYNYLLETETPLNKFEITKYVINRAIQDQERAQQERISSLGIVYLPENNFNIGDVLVFSQRNDATGRVISTRKGNNPDYPDLQVIDVEFSTGDKYSYAANLSNHALNNPLPKEKGRLLDPQVVYEEFGTSLAENIVYSCDQSSDLVCIARHYFPRALLFDISIGHLNLCEAVLEMSNGGPLSTSQLIEQIELPIGTNKSLTEFSLNYALENDGRFDEVGPSGVTLWFLKRMEPQEVQKPPFTLQYSLSAAEVSEPLVGLEELNRLVFDELEAETESVNADEITISLSYPHWRAGTMPLTNQLKGFFPTAYETPRVQFSFVDGHNQETFSGWVVRPHKYVYGLKNWYAQQGIIPGSNITIRHSKNPGEVLISTSKSKNSRDWIRTVLVGADGVVVFALLKQVIQCTYDDRMAIMITDVEAIDAIWTNPARVKLPVEKVIHTIMREIGKLNTQNQIHAQELYSAVNVVRRVPPSQILSTLYTQPWATHLGDLYFKLEEST